MPCLGSVRYHAQGDGTRGYPYPMQEDSKPTRETAPPASAGCASDCASETSIEALNRSCYCLSLDEPALRKGLDADLGSRGLSQAMVRSHPHLFSAVPMFVSREHLDQMARVIGAVEEVVATPHFRQAALAWAPEIARRDPGSPGGLLGFDFHLAVAGPIASARACAICGQAEPHVALR